MRAIVAQDFSRNNEAMRRRADVIIAELNLALSLPRDDRYVAYDLVTQFPELSDGWHRFGQDIGRILLSTNPMDLELAEMESVQDLQLSQIYESALIAFD